MRQRTQLAGAILAAQGAEAYDAHVRTVLSFGAVLAEILAGCVREFQGMPRTAVEPLIEGGPEVGGHPLHVEDEAEWRVAGSQNDENVLAEGRVGYDIRFDARAPGGGEVSLIVNVEAQKDASPGYSLFKRATYYAGRLISAQRGPVFRGSDYGKLRKVVTVWVCPRPPERTAGTIRRYSLSEELLAGGPGLSRGEYDTVEIVFIDLPRHPSATSNRLLGLLGTLLSAELSAEEKLGVLASDYGIDASPIEGEVGSMTLGEMILEEKREQGYGEGFERGVAEGIEKGIEQGIEQGIKIERNRSAAGFLVSVMSTLGLGANEALDSLGVPAEQREEVARLAGVAL